MELTNGRECPNIPFRTVGDKYCKDCKHSVNASDKTNITTCKYTESRVGRLKDAECIIYPRRELTVECKRTNEILVGSHVCGECEYNHGFTFNIADTYTYCTYKAKPDPTPNIFDAFN